MNSIGRYIPPLNKTISPFQIPLPPQKKRQEEKKNPGTTSENDIACRACVTGLLGCHYELKCLQRVECVRSCCLSHCYFWATVNVSGVVILAVT